MTTMPSPTPPRLTSSANPRIRAAIVLRERRHRDETGLTIIDGARELRRALDAGVEIVEAFICEEQLAGPDARAAFDRLMTAATVTHMTTGSVMSKLAFGQRSEGLVAVARIPTSGLADLPIGDGAMVLVVEGVEKPGNLGAALRSADGAGVDALVAASPVADLFNPNTIRASAGTVFSVPITAAPTLDVLAWLRRSEIRIVAARVDAAVSYVDVDLTGRLAIVVGAEAPGLTDLWDADDIESVALPMLGIADSLNVSVTAAILLYEARRQRDLVAGPSRS
jgi:RNA methyltransferase, TrmH family